MWLKDLDISAQCYNLWQRSHSLTLPSEDYSIWSGRIFCIECYLGIFTRCLYCVSVFHFTISMYLLRTLHPMLHCICMYRVCWCHGLRLPDLNKETTYLLTYIVSVKRWKSLRQCHRTVQQAKTTFSVSIPSTWSCHCCRYRSCRTRRSGCVGDQSQSCCQPNAPIHYRMFYA